MRKVHDREFFYEITMPDKQTKATQQQLNHDMNSNYNNNNNMLMDNFMLQQQQHTDSDFGYQDDELQAETERIHGIMLNTQRRKELMSNFLGGQNLLKTDQLKEKVRMQNQNKMIRLGLSGDRLMVRSGGGFLDFIEFLQRKGFFTRAQIQHQGEQTI